MLHDGNPSYSLVPFDGTPTHIFSRDCFGSLKPHTALKLRMAYKQYNIDHQELKATKEGEQRDGKIEAMPVLRREGKDIPKTMRVPWMVWGWKQIDKVPHSGHL